MLTKSISNWFASSFPSLAKMFGIEASTSSSQVKPDVKNEEDEKKKKEEEAKEQKGYEKYILKSTAFIK